jgi:hypothetical protein
VVVWGKPGLLTPLRFLLLILTRQKIGNTEVIDVETPHDSEPDKRETSAELESLKTDTSVRGSIAPPTRSLDDISPTHRGAWMNTRMERDKTLLTLASAGIGFLLTLLKAFEIPVGFLRILYVLAGASLLVTVCTAVVIFGQNAGYLEALDKSVSSAEKRATRLRFLDRVISVSFLVGVLAFVGIAVTALLSK